MEESEIDIQDRKSVQPERSSGSRTKPLGLVVL